MQRIFKNACVVNIENGRVIKTNILVSNGKIENFGDFDDFSGDVVDLHNDFVVPNFVNVFCHSFYAFEKNYKSLENANAKVLGNVENLMKVKNILAGAVCNDVAAKDNQNCYLLEKVDELEENQLSEISNFVAKQKSKLFMKVGQSLDELGTIDKAYRKPLSQVLEDFGILDRKPILVGGNCFEKDELQTLSQYDCDVCLTVGEDGKFGRRPTNLASLSALDFCVGIGSGCSFEIDFFGFMRQLLMTQRGLFEDENCISEQDVLKIATLNGSKILNGEDNALKEGANADFMVIKNNASLYDDIFKILVWEKSKRDVIMTVGQGEILQKNGEIFMKNLPQYDTIINELQQHIRRN